MQFNPIDFPVGWRQLYPCGKSLAYLSRLQGSRQTDGVFSWPRFRMIQAWQVWARHLTEAKHTRAAKTRRNVCIRVGLGNGQRCPAVMEQPYRGNITGSTINTKPSVLDYHGEQVAVKDKGREKVKGSGEKGGRWLWDCLCPYSTAQEGSGKDTTEERL